MSPNKFIKVLEIIGPHLDKGMDTGYFMGAEHDIVYLYVGADKIPEDSPEGEALIELGCHFDEADSWAMFV